MLGDTGPIWCTGQCMTPLYHPQMMTDVEQSVKWEVAEETEVPREKLLLRPFVHHINSTWPDSGLNLGHSGGKMANRWTQEHYSIIYTWSYKTNSVAFSPQVNYTDWATATCQRNLVPTCADRGVSHGQCGRSPMVVNLSFLDRSCYFSFM
jgi:hypothetical protein